MKLNLELKVPTKPGWIEAVMNDFDSFLQDHADCERKASSTAMSLVAKYPDKLEIIPELIETAVEELEHFQMVYKLMVSRGISLQHKIPGDPYIKTLIQRMHSGIKERFLDRLLVASVVETRGAERFRIVAEAQTDADLQKFYKTLWISEAKHGHIYVGMALNYFSEDQVYERLEWWNNMEGEILDSLPFRPALH